MKKGKQEEIRRKLAQYGEANRSATEWIIGWCLQSLDNIQVVRRLMPNCDLYVENRNYRIALKTLYGCTEHPLIERIALADGLAVANNFSWVSKLEELARAAADVTDVDIAEYVETAMDTGRAFYKRDTHYKAALGEITEEEASARLMKIENFKHIPPNQRTATTLVGEVRFMLAEEPTTEYKRTTGSAIIDAFCSHWTPRKVTGMMAATGSGKTRDIVYKILALSARGIACSLVTTEASGSRHEVITHMLCMIADQWLLREYHSVFADPKLESLTDDYVTRTRDWQSNPKYKRAWAIAEYILERLPITISDPEVHDYRPEAIKAEWLDLYSRGALDVTFLDYIQAVNFNSGADDDRDYKLTLAAKKWYSDLTVRLPNAAHYFTAQINSSGFQALYQGNANQINASSMKGGSAVSELTTNFAWIRTHQSDNPRTEPNLVVVHNTKARKGAWGEYTMSTTPSGMPYEWTRTGVEKKFPITMIPTDWLDEAERETASYTLPLLPNS